MHYVTGHKNPDADSVASAIVYAWYLRQTGIDPEATPVMLGEPSKEAQFLLERTGFAWPEILTEFPAGSTLHIVDTSNPAELHDLSGCTIASLVDHHKLSGLTTSEPLMVSMAKVGCTATILTDMINMLGTTVPKQIALLVLGAIYSDTLNFTSPTTTERDRQAAVYYASIAEIEGQEEEMVREQFAAKSDLTGQTPLSIVTSDSKIFEMGVEKLHIGSHETAMPEIALGMASQLRGALEQHVAAEGLSGGLFFIVDILKSEAYLITSNERIQGIATQAYGCTFTDGIAHLPGVVSRKAQMVPPLQTLLG